MLDIIRSALWCAAVCFGIFATAQLLRGLGVLSFLPENDTGRAIAALGAAAAQEGWSDGLVAVFAAHGK